MGKKLTYLNDVLKNIRTSSNKIGSVKDRTFTYAEFLSYIEFESMYLKKMGIKNNENVLILVNDNFKRLVVFWACIRIGAVPCFIPVNKQQFIENQSYFINFLNEPYIITENKIPKLNKLILYKPWDSKKNIFYDYQEHRDFDEKVIIFSSGTTGLPKAVMYTGQQLIENALSIQRKKHYTSSDKLYSWLPVNHIFGLILHIIAMISTADQLYSNIDEFIADPQIWFEQICKNKITITSSTMMGLQFCISIKEKLTNYDISSLRQLVLGGEAINKDTVNKFYSCFSNNGISLKTIKVGYGLTECGIISMSEVKWETLRKQPERIGENVHFTDKSGNTAICLGAPYDSYKVIIKDNSGCVLKEGMYGKVYIKSSVNAYGLDETPNNEVNTGDLGFLKDNQLFICGRDKEVLILNGQNINLNIINDFITHNFDVKSFVIRDTTLNIDQGIIIFILSTSIKNENNIDDIKKMVFRKFQIGAIKIKIVNQFELLESGKLDRRKMIEQYVL